ncbi:MAG: BACON domain-containing protein [Bacteroidales bacterium]|nr:BACON domain-containing protein [Bacteroidales bacterium]
MKKIFNILMSSLAVAALASSCLKEGEPLAKSVEADVTELQPFEAEDSRAQTIKVTSDGDWVAGAPSWIKLSAYSGNGNAEITVTPLRNFEKDSLGVESQAAPRSGVITIGGANATCVISVRQRGDKGKTLVIYETISIKDFLKLKDDASKFYHLTGTICGEYNNFATYGNFYMTDGKDTVLVYGLTATKQSSNDKSFSTLGLGIGDEVSLAGYHTSYKGDPQVGGAYVYDPEKQNVQISPESYEAAIDTGDFVLDIVARGPYTVNPSADWIVCEEPDADHLVKVHIKGNPDPKPREGKITVTVTIGEQTQSLECKISQKFNEPALSTIAEAKELPLKSTVRVHGRVMMASTSTGYIINDGTANLLVYAKTSYAAGDSVKVIAQTSTYNYGFQLGSPYFQDKLGKAKTTPADAPIQVDSVALVEKTTLANGSLLPCELVEIVGTIYKSGNYAAAKNLAEKKAVNYTASLFTPKGMNLLTDDYLDKKVKLTGYYTAYKSSSKQLTIYLTKVEPITEVTPE